MTQPVRLQLLRRKGFDLQALSQATNGLPAMKVSQPGRWGNPYSVDKVRYSHAKSIDWAGRCTSPLWVSWANSHMKAGQSVELDSDLQRIAVAVAIALFEIEVLQFKRSDPASFARWLAPLRGKNLACWCEAGPCHADVLVEFANRPICEAAP